MLNRLLAIGGFTMMLIMMAATNWVIIYSNGRVMYQNTRKLKQTHEI